MHYLHYYLAVFEILAKAEMLAEEIRGIKVRKEKVKSSLFANGILYLGSLKK